VRFAVDSNVLIYAEGAEDDWRQGLALALLNQLGTANILLPLQAAGETLNWLIRKAKLSRGEAVSRIVVWLRACRLQDTSVAVVEAAQELVRDHGFQVWDAVILAAASAGSASVLLSEDMHDGFEWRGVTIINPFSPQPAPIIRLLIRNG
jgi:predicted nucleic acid-binding protein